MKCSVKSHKKMSLKSFRQPLSLHLYSILLNSQVTFLTLYKVNFVTFLVESIVKSQYSKYIFVFCRIFHGVLGLIVAIPLLLRRLTILFHNKFAEKYVKYDDYGENGYPKECRQSAEPVSMLVHCDHMRFVGRRCEMKKIGD